MDLTFGQMGEIIPGGVIGHANELSGSAMRWSP